MLVNYASVRDIRNAKGGRSEARGNIEIQKNSRKQFVRQGGPDDRRTSLTWGILRHIRTGPV